MRFIELDFETKSLCDLKLCGAERYSEDVSTEVLTLSILEDGIVIGRWWPGQGHTQIRYLISQSDVMFVAHNAGFEQAIWRNQMVAIYGFPPIRIERWDCTLAACAWKGYPLALDKAGRAARLNIVKDKEGSKLTLGLSKLDKKTGMLPTVTPEILERVMAYCDDDVRVEHGVMKHVGLISRESKQERKIWIYDQTINQRGVRLDMGFVEAAQLVVSRATGPLLAEFQKLTGIQKLGSPKLKDWCREQGVPVENLQKGYLAELLGSDDDDGEPDAGYDSLADEYSEGMPVGQVPELVQRVLTIRQMLGGAAVKKLPRMQACVGYDGRARGLLQYHAAHSGRWGGRLLQPQNFPRETSGLAPDDAVSVILSADPEVVEREFGLPALEAVARSLRHALVPDPGKVFLVGDYTQIEARVVLALAGQHDKCQLLADGQDPYLDMASRIFGRRILKDEKENRQLGKAGVLGCGFQCGAEKFKFMCSKAPYNMEISLERAEETVQTYRKEWAPKVPNVWYRTQEVAFKAAEENRRTEAYGVIWQPEGEWLTATLPNRWQKLWYPYPRLGVGKFGDPCWKYMRVSNKGTFWVDMYGGLETENVVQALARGLLCAAIDRLERAGFPVVLTVHDEIICEVPLDKADEALVQFRELMIEPTVWAEEMGIPINVEEAIMTRYRK